MAKCLPEDVSKKLSGLIKDYYNHPPTLKIVGKDGNAFKKMYRATTGQDFEFGDMPSLKDLSRLDRRLKTFQSRLLKGAPGKIARLFYLPEEFLKGNPDAARTFDSFVINHNHYSRVISRSLGIASRLGHSLAERLENFNSQVITSVQTLVMLLKKI